MTAKPVVLTFGDMPDGALARLADEFTAYEFVDARDPAVLDRRLAEAVVSYGAPPTTRLAEAPSLRWIQLFWAGVPRDLCPAAQRQNITVTNAAGLYGPTIAEHTLALMTVLARNLHLAFRNQQERRWDRGVAKTMSDLRGRTLALVGVGNIGRHVARLASAYGMRVLGCRRTDRAAPHLDRLYRPNELHAMLAEADYVVVAAPLTAHTEGMLGPAEFQAMKRGVIYVNVSRGGIAQEQALLAALQSGQVAAAGLDVFATEPLPPEHLLWTLPNVVITPHYSGETVNSSLLPVERFARNLRAWSAGRPLEGLVSLEWGY
jgi:D-2-hydroxyacid dehydrogenase (NADP+)